MCGRFVLDSTASQLARQFAVRVDGSVTPRYNIAPSEPILTVIQNAEKRSLSSMKWGLIPSWVKSLDSWKGNLEERTALLSSLPTVDLEIYPVSKIVNSPQNDSPECIQPISN